MLILDFSLLKGIKVLDTTVNIPGPVAGLLLRQLGAEVVKIDPPFGDFVSAYPGLDERINGSKRRVRLNLKAAAGREELGRHIGWADVVVSGFRLHTLQALGLDYETVRGLNPSVVYAHLTGFPGDGPDGQRAGHDLTMQAESGLLRHLFSGRALAPVPFADLSCALFAVLSVLAALVERGSNGGHGKYLEINMQESPGIFYLLLINAEPSLLDYLQAEKVCYHVYATKDDYIAVGVLENKFFDAMAKALGHPEFAGQGDGPATAENPVYQRLKEIFESRDTAYWAEWGKARDLPLSPLQSPLPSYRFPLRIRG